MKTKNMLQLLMPFASTIAIFIVFWILSFLIWIIGYLLFALLNIDAWGFENIIESIYDFLQVNIFEYRDNHYDVNINMVVFWILNTIIIILGELWILSEDWD